MIEEASIYPVLLPMRCVEHMVLVIFGFVKYTGHPIDVNFGVCE